MSYIQDLLTDEDVFPTKAGKSHFIYVASSCITFRIPKATISSLFFQVQRFRRASSFSSKRCFCCFSGLWLTFTRLTTERRSRWACTHTSTHSSNTSHSSAGSTPCWSRRTLSRCRTSSQLWDSKAEHKERAHTHVVHSHFHHTLIYLLYLVIRLYSVSRHSGPNLLHSMDFF